MVEQGSTKKAILDKALDYSQCRDMKPLPLRR